MDPTTEIASKFTVAHYKDVRPRLDPATPQTRAWSDVLAVFRRRIEERFLLPIAQLSGGRRTSPRSVPGFAILALDCLLPWRLEGAGRHGSDAVKGCDWAAHDQPQALPRGDRAGVRGVLPRAGERNGRCACALSSSDGRDLWAARSSW